MRKLSASVLLALAVVGMTSVPASAGKPDVLFCTLPGKDGKDMEIGYWLGGKVTIAEAVQMCVDNGGHPSGVGWYKSAPGPTK